MGKLVDIKNGEQEKAFELHSDEEALYLSVKCSDNRSLSFREQWKEISRVEK